MSRNMLLQSLLMRVAFRRVGCKPAEILSAFGYTGKVNSQSRWKPRGCSVVMGYDISYRHISGSLPAPARFVARSIFQRSRANTFRTSRGVRAIERCPLASSRLAPHINLLRNILPGDLYGDRCRGRALQTLKNVLIAQEKAYFKTLVVNRSDR